ELVPRVLRQQAPGEGGIQFVLAVLQHHGGGEHRIQPGVVQVLDRAGDIDQLRSLLLRPFDDDGVVAVLVDLVGQVGRLQQGLEGGVGGAGGRRGGGEQGQQDQGQEAHAGLRQGHPFCGGGRPASTATGRRSV